MMHSLNNTTRRLEPLVNKTLLRLRPKNIHIFIALLLGLWAKVGQAAIYQECQPHRDVIEIDDYTRLPQDGSCSKCFKNGRLIGSPQTREITPANGYRCSRKANSLEQAKEILRATNGGRSDGGNNRPSSVNRGYDDYNQQEARPQSSRRAPNVGKATLIPITGRETPPFAVKVICRGGSWDDARTATLTCFDGVDGLCWVNYNDGKGETDTATSCVRAISSGQSHYDQQPSSYRSQTSGYGTTSYGGQEQQCEARSRSDGMESYIPAGFDDSLICKYCDVQGKGQNPGKCYVRNANGTKGHHWVSEKVWHELYGRRRLAEDKLHRRQLVALKTRASTN